MEIPIERKFAKSLKIKELPFFPERYCILGDVNRINLFSLSFTILSDVAKFCFNGKYLYVF